MTRKAKLYSYIDTKLLECRFLKVVETVATIFMSILKFTHKIIFYICKYSGGNFLSCIFFPFSFPILEVHTFLFKFVYLSRKRRLFVLRSHDFGLCINDSAIELDDCFLKLCGISDYYKRLPYGKGGAER